MAKRYNPKDIEPKWQKIWEDTKIYQTQEDPGKPKKYILEYFPYPSGAAMHVGHVRNYSIGDALARFSRMRGFNVLHPMGWDAFGLPAENYAIKTGISPREAIDQNTARFKEQLMQMGFSYDWSREIDSTDPAYYRWTQWFFLLLFKKGLAYQQASMQWWCPVDKTVLANEQVEAGKCWRCGNTVEKKALKQWFFKITDYADRLAKDLDDVNWSESIKSMQRNWIGKSKGAEVDFAIDERDEKIRVFTTRPDTLFGATFMVLAPEHPLASAIASSEQKTTVEEYIRQAQAKSDIERQETEREKTGVFTGAYAVNPVNDEKIPIWVADYVLMGYGTGAIMAVPAHDERDLEFAKKFDLPVTFVVEPSFGEVQGDEVEKNAIVAVVKHWSEDKYLVLNWGPRKERYGGTLFVGGGVDGDEFARESAKREITEETGYTNLEFVNEMPETFHTYYFSNVKNKNYYAKCRGMLFVLKDNTQIEQKLDEGEKQKFSLEWVAREEIPSCISDNGHALVFQRLVLENCFHGEGLMTNSGPYNGLSTFEVREKIIADLASKGVAEEKVNYRMRDWLISRQRYWGAPIPIIHCPKDGAVAVPEDQLPVQLPNLKTFEPSGDGRSPLARVPEFVQTTCPTCGGPAERETDTMDGFACSSWYFMRFADPHNDSAPFSKEKIEQWLPVDDYIGGAEHAVMHLLYARFWTKVMYDEGMISFEEPFKTLRNQGMILAPDGQKMSKSKGNTIEPGSLIEQGYGADATRVMELFIGPWNQSAAWSVEGVGGVYRFLQRVWTITQDFLESQEEENNEAAEQVLAVTHRTIKRVSHDLDELGFNTAVAALMECVNDLYKIKASHGFKARDAWKQAIHTLVQMVAPFAPHISEELWHDLGSAESVHMSAWPVHDESLLVRDTITVVVQVNGKVRAELELAADVTEQQAIDAALANENVQPWLENKTVRKTIYVPSKLVSIVVN